MLVQQRRGSKRPKRTDFFTGGKELTQIYANERRNLRNSRKRTTNGEERKLLLRAERERLRIRAVCPPAAYNRGGVRTARSESGSEETVQRSYTVRSCQLFAADPRWAAQTDRTTAPDRGHVRISADRLGQKRGCVQRGGGHRRRIGRGGGTARVPSGADSCSAAATDRSCAVWAGR